MTKKDDERLRQKEAQREAQKEIDKTVRQNDELIRGELIKRPPEMLVEMIIKLMHGVFRMTDKELSVEILDEFLGFVEQIDNKEESEDCSDDKN